MAQPSTVLRFNLEISDVDRGLYEKVELRIARHPSESAPFLLARVIAYALNFQEGIAFSGGIATPDDPAISVKDLTGLLLMWIDVGNPAAKRLHKAAKAAKQVRVYTYRDVKVLQDEMAGANIYNAQAIEIFALAPKFMTQLEATLARDNAWQLLYDDGELSITANSVAVQGELAAHRLA